MKKIIIIFIYIFVHFFFAIFSTAQSSSNQGKNWSNYATDKVNKLNRLVDRKVVYHENSVEISYNFSTYDEQNRNNLLAINNEIATDTSNLLSDYEAVQSGITDFIAIPPGYEPIIQNVDTVYKEIALSSEITPDRLPSADNSTSSSICMIKIDTITTCRGIELLPISILPMENNVAYGNKHCVSAINYKIGFIKKKTEISPQKVNASNLEFVRCLALNPETIADDKVAVYDNVETPEGYIILSHPYFRKAIDALAHNKRLLGYNVCILLDSCWTEGLIKNRIIEKCRKVENMKYLCIIGNHKYVPPVMLRSVGLSESGNYPSDIPYGQIKHYTVDISLHVGRIPVANPDTAELIISKLREYEFNPAMPSEFYKTVTHIAQFIESKTYMGKDSVGFVTHMERNSKHLEDNFNTKVNRLYWAYSQVNPKYWSNGDAIPENLQRPNFRWDQGPRDFERYLETGTNYVVCMAHGTSDRWEIPEMQSNVFRFYRNRYQPFVISLSCQTGRYSSDVTTPCLAESLLCNPYGGAIGVIAVSDEILITCVKPLSYAFTNCIWGSPTISDSDNTYFDKKVTSFGNMTDVAFLSVANSADYRLIVPYRNLFNLFGDPSMNLRTKLPETYKCNVTQEAYNNYKCEITGGVKPQNITIVDRYLGKLTKFPAECTTFNYKTDHPEFVSVCLSGDQSVPLVIELGNNNKSLIIDNSQFEAVSGEYDHVLIGDSFNANTESVDIKSPEVRLRAKGVTILPNTTVDESCDFELIISE